MAPDLTTELLAFFKAGMHSLLSTLPAPMHNVSYAVPAQNIHKLIAS